MLFCDDNNEVIHLWLLCVPVSPWTYVTCNSMHTSENLWDYSTIGFLCKTNGQHNDPASVLSCPDFPTFYWGGSLKIERITILHRRNTYSPPEEKWLNLHTFSIRIIYKKSKTKFQNIAKYGWIRVEKYTLRVNPA